MAVFSKLLRVMVLFAVLPLTAQSTFRDLGRETWQFRKISDNKWFAAQVPGTVHTDLLANQLIPDPFFGTNEKQLQWIENEDWEYQTVFSVSAAEIAQENSLLQFEGLDTYAEVFLNGQKILVADNMFRTWNIAVKKHLKRGQNSLRIVFSSAVKKGKAEAQKLPYTLPGDEKIFTRKAQYQYGWDWGPRLVTAGIWKNISIRFWSKASFKNIYCEQKELHKDKAKLLFHVTVNVEIPGNYTLKSGENGVVRKLQKGINKVSIPIEINNPQLWWPNGMGEPHQYQNIFSLWFKGKKLEEKTLKTGLRTIELVQEKDDIGKSFYFKVNGVPVFMKGANYIPPDSFLPRADAAVYQRVVENAVNANMNMLRVWGGGVYADEAFYEACDAKGILVWQDFMFACAMYPGNTAFLENVKQEITDNVTRLQNHPCIALWCGNNENDEGWKNWGWQKQYGYSQEQETAIWNDYKKLFHELIPQTLSHLLPPSENRYWPSSPSIGWGRKESLLEGDSHYWGVWWGKELFEVYEKKVGRFMSEYGFQGMPTMSTFRSFANTEDLNLGSEAVKNHQKHPTGYETINEYMARDYIVPKSFDHYSYVSQLLQAEGIKTAIEAHRRAKPYCMGSLYWQLNDCWPVTSWSSVDYFGSWKALHYQVQHSFENLMVSLEEDDNNYKVYLINDDMKPYKGDLKISLLDFKGNELWKIEEVVEVKGNIANSRFDMPKKDLIGKEITKSLLSIAYKTQDHKEVKALYYFVKPKELELTQPTITIHQIDPTTIEISADVLAKNVFLTDGDIFFSDNYFDLLPNQKVQIKLSKPANNIVVKSLFDTMH